MSYRRNSGGDAPAHLSLQGGDKGQCGSARGCFHAATCEQELRKHKPACQPQRLARPRVCLAHLARNGLESGIIPLHHERCHTATNKDSQQSSMQSQCTAELRSIFQSTSIKHVAQSLTRGRNIERAKLTFARARRAMTSSMLAAGLPPSEGRRAHCTCM